jgi:phage FluMu protein Com
VSGSDVLVREIRCKSCNRKAAEVEGAGRVRFVCRRCNRFNEIA